MNENLYSDTEWEKLKYSEKICLSTLSTPQMLRGMVWVRT